MSNLPPLPPLPPRPAGRPSQDSGNPSLPSQNLPIPSQPIPPLGSLKQPSLVPQQENVLSSDMPFAPQSVPASNLPVATPIDPSKDLTINNNILKRWFKGMLISSVVTAIICAIFAVFRGNSPILLGIIGFLLIAVIGLVGAPFVHRNFKLVVFNLANGTMKIGKNETRLIKEITYAMVTHDQNNTMLYLGFDKKHKVSIWVKGLALSATKEDLEALYALIPYTSLPDEGDNTVGKISLKHYVSKTTLMGLLTP